MNELLLILIGTVLVNNIVLTRFPALRPFPGVSDKLDIAIGMALATTFVLTLSSALTYLIYHYLLQPFEVVYLRIIAFILVITAVTKFTELIVRNISPLLHELLGILLPLIVINCAVLGIALLTIQEARGFLQSLTPVIGGAVGFSLVLVLFTALRERIAVADVPLPFRGAAIAMITAGIMSMAFMGFSGLIRG